VPCTKNDDDEAVHDMNPHSLSEIEYNYYLRSYQRNMRNRLYEARCSVKLRYKIKSANNSFSLTMGGRGRENMITAAAAQSRHV